jgi:hypothetical protein
MQFKPYNRKAFLLPDSIHSMAAFQAKLFPDGKYIFRIHDCLSGIRLTGELKEEQDFIDAFDKAAALSLALFEFAAHIDSLRNKLYEPSPEPAHVSECHSRDRYAVADQIMSEMNQ